jgi:hypothetical protein
LLVPLTGSWSAGTQGGVLAYVGLGSGQEFIPYFLGLVAWTVAAFLAILQWPLTALFRRFFKRKEVKDEPNSEPRAADVQESARESSEVKR